MRMDEGRSTLGWMGDAAREQGADEASVGGEAAVTRMDKCKTIALS